MAEKTNTTNARLIAAVAVFIAALVGLHYDVSFSGWGIFIAFILAVSTT